MQEIKAPDNYDWSEFERKPRGFLSIWCRDHQFKYHTVRALIKGYYVSGSGPVISEIIRVALQEALISEIPYDQAA